MREEVEGHRLIRDTLELELLALRERMLTVENFSDNMDSANSNCEQEAEDQISKSEFLHLLRLPFPLSKIQNLCFIFSILGFMVIVPMQANEK